MTKQRRSFSAEFKREAADNCSYIEASRSIGVGESARRRWVDQVPQERQGVTLQSKALILEHRKFRNWKPGLPTLNGKNRY